MIYKNKKAGIGSLLLVLVVIIVFFATYPFMQSTFDAAASVNTGFIANAISFMPFIALLGFLVWIIQGGTPN